MLCVMRKNNLQEVDWERKLAKGLVSSDRKSHALTYNLGSTEHTTYTVSCPVICMVELYDSLICAHKGIL
jgi:hypothetical protein